MGTKHKNHRKRLHINMIKLKMETGQSSSERVKYKNAISSESRDMFL